MLKKVLTAALACLVVAAQAGARGVGDAQGAKDAQSSAEVRAKLDRAGTGERARVTVRMKDGARRRGYVSERRETEFVLRDRKTGEPSIIAYDNVSKVESGYGHSAVRNWLLATGIGIGGALLVWGILIGTSDD